MAITPEIQKLIDQVKAAPASLKEISVATGLGWHWLRALTEGRIRSPGYEKVETLKKHLAELRGDEAA